MANQFDEIISVIKKSVKDFDKKIPATQRAMYDEITAQLQRLDLDINDNIKPTVGNLKVIQSIKNKLNKLIISPEYIKDVKEFVKTFNTITFLQNSYWKTIEQKFKPKAILKQIRIQSIRDTVSQLTESGVAANVGDSITNLLRNNITTGGSYKALQAGLREQLLNTETDGLLQRYTKTVTITALNSYTRQYTQTVSDDLGFEWYSYQGSEILTSRPFCQAMVENNRYFHVSQIGNLIQGLDASGVRLKYSDNVTGEEKSVTVNPKTGLPSGFIAGTNVSNFLVNAGGWTCGHTPRPVPERNVPKDIQEIVYGTSAYNRWKGK